MYLFVLVTRRLVQRYIKYSESRSRLVTRGKRVSSVSYHYYSRRKRTRTKYIIKLDRKVNVVPFLPFENFRPRDRLVSRYNIHGYLIFRHLEIPRESCRNCRTVDIRSMPFAARYLIIEFPVRRFLWLVYIRE